MGFFGIGPRLRGGETRFLAHFILFSVLRAQLARQRVVGNWPAWLVGADSERHRLDKPDARKFSGAVRSAAKREWPRLKRTITPYCLRHQAAADWKADPDMAADDVSRALGHATDKTKSHYGQAGQARRNGKGPVVTAAKEIKHTKRLQPSEQLKHDPMRNASQGLTF